MELSIFLAKMLGVTFIIIGAAFLLKYDFYRTMYEKIIRTEMTLVTLGLVAVLASAALVVSHNFWAWSWPVIITILGWVGLVKGILLLLIPEHTHKAFGKIFKRQAFIITGGLFWLIFGLILAYLGFMG